MAEERDSTDRGLGRSRPLSSSAENDRVGSGTGAALATFREVHYRWAQEYIDRWVDDPRGTGGTPYMVRLRQLIDETRAHKLPV